MLKRFFLSVIVVCSVSFVVISLLLVWGVINSGSDIVWKLLASLGLLGFSGLMGIVIVDHLNKN